MLGLDLGSVRIGVAISDSARTLATPREVLRRSGDQENDLELLAALIDDTGATEVVVGLPVSLDGSRGPAAAGVEAEAAQLRERVSVPVQLIDERLSSVEATTASTRSAPAVETAGPLTARIPARARRRRRGGDRPAGVSRFPPRAVTHD